MRGKLVVGATVPITAKLFLSDQLRFLANKGWEVHLVTSPGAELGDVARAFDGHPRLHIHTIPMAREPSPFNDARALIRWIALLSRLQPDVVMSGTPKAGLLGMLAARVAGIKSRVYLLRGLRLEGLSGISARFHLVLERLTCAAATSVICVSPSLKRVAGSRRIASTEKLMVLGSGGSNGVDIDKFCPATPEQRTGARAQFGIDKKVITVGFAGRLTHDKGLPWLVTAMRRVAQSHPNVWLVVAGSATGEERPFTNLPIEEPWFHALGDVQDMPMFYRALDVFCLPSLREGFPNSTAEALATGIPVVTTDATGCIDSVLHGETGLVVPTKDGVALARAIEVLVDRKDLRARMGATGRAQALSHWRNHDVWQRTSAFLAESITPRRNNPRRRRRRSHDADSNSV